MSMDQSSLPSKRSRIAINDSILDVVPIPTIAQQNPMRLNYQRLESLKYSVQNGFITDPKKKKNDEIVRFALKARCCADKALSAVQHALLRQQADALAYIMQHTVKYNRNKSNNSPEFEHSVHLPNQRFEEHNTSAAPDELDKTLRDAGRKAMLSLREVKKHMKRTSAEAGSWHLDTREVRRFTNRLVEVERGLVLEPCFSSMEPPIISSDFDKVYLIEANKGGRFYSASKSAVDRIQGMRSSQHFNGKDGSFVMGLCFIEEVGHLVLLLLPGCDPNEPDKYILVLQLLESTLRLNLGDCDANSICLLFPMTYRRVIVANLGLAVLTLLKIHTDGVSNTFTIVRQLQLNRKQLISFSFNETCGFALATYNNVARVLALDSKVHYRTTIEIDNRQHAFRKCAVSSHPIFFLSKSINRVHSEIQLFDVHGQQLRRVGNGKDSCQLFNTLIPSNLNFVIFNGTTADELHLLHFSCFDRSLQYVKVSSSQRGFAHQICFVDLENVNRKEIEWSRHYVLRVMMENKASLIDYSRLHVSGDRRNPSVRYFVEDEAAFYILAIANNTVQRFAKVPTDNTEDSPYKLQNDCTQYKPEQQSSPDDFITAFEILDEKTLVVLHSNSTLVHVDATTMRRLHSVRFTNTRLAKYRSAATISKVAETKLFVAVEGDKAVYEVERTQHSTDWHLVKLHKLPRPWKLQHIHFDTNSRRFSLVLTKNEQHTPICIMNDLFVMVSKISLPMFCHVYACLLNSDWCFLKILYDANYTAWSFCNISTGNIFPLVRATCHAWTPLHFTLRNNSEFFIDEFCDHCLEVVRTTYVNYATGDV